MRTLHPAPAGRDPAALRRWLDQRLDGIAQSASAKPQRAAAPTGWPEVDAVLGGGLRTGALHEWHAPGDASRTRDLAWSPPLRLLAHLAVSAARATAPDEQPGWIAWIGRRVWPYAPALARLGGAPLVRRSLLVDPEVPGSSATRLWAIDAALRSPALVVVADGAGLALAETRRLQLSAESGASIGLLARPRWDRATRSAAATRWEVNAGVSDEGVQQWEIVLAACKGARPLGAGTGRWLLERRCDGVVRVVPVLGVRHGETALAS